MRNPSKHARRLSAAALAIVLVFGGIAAVAVAAGAGGAKSAKVKVKCPRKVLGGKKVTCRVIGELPQGPVGPQGPRGQSGPKGQKGDKGPKGDKGQKGDAGPKGDAGAVGPAGADGVSGYEVVSQTFKGVFIENSGSFRGLSEVKTVSCPTGKRAVGGGTDLGTNPTQNGQQRSVSVSMSAPNGTGTGWSAQLFNNEVSGGGTSIDLKVYAVCATAS